MIDVHFDFETYSECDLKEAGTWAYSEHPSTEVICMSYAFGDDKPQMWLPGDPTPYFLTEESHGEFKLHAHNSFFEWCIIKNTMKLEPPPIECWVDTAAMAAALSLPRALMNLCPVLGVKLKDAKDKYGMFLIRKLSVPQKYTNKQIKDQQLKEGATYRNRDPELLKKFYEYCIQDVVAGRACEKIMIPLSPSEQEVWQIDQVINIRGVNVDVELVEHCIAIYEKQRDKLEAELKEMTGLEKPNSQQQFLGWATERGYTEDNLQADTLRDFLETGKGLNLLNAAIILKVSLSRTAPKKFYALLRRLGIDGRNHGSFMFHGAGTGRWASLGINLQNLLRPKMEDVDLIISMLPEHDHELLELYWGDVIEALASCIRGMLIASPGGRLIICDYAQVEARIIAWLAGEEGTLEVFRQGKDIYTHEASKIFQMDSRDVGKDERFAGKTAVLACIAEGELVLTNQGLVPIQEITTCMKVWDGVEWVNHSGLIYRGEKNVSEYQGLTATPDHIVWTEEFGPVKFAHASKSRAHLIQSGSGWQAIRVGDCDITRTKVYPERLARTESSNSVLRMSNYKMDQLVEFDSGYFQRMPTLQPAETSPKMAKSETYSSEREMYKSSRSKLGELWETRDKISISERDRCRLMDDKKFRSAPITKAGDRPNRQQRPLCSREFKMGNSLAAVIEYPENTHNKLETQKNSSPARISCVPSFISESATFRRNTLEVVENFKTTRNSEKVEYFKIVQTKRRVWDILNAGPRNRFTVSEKLVHNCGFQGGWSALQRMAKNYGKVLEDKFCNEIVMKWRKNNPRIVAYWEALEQAAIEAIRNPDKGFLVQDFMEDNDIPIPPIKYKFAEGYLFCQLPSGRLLAYASPSLVTKTVRYFKIEDGEFARSVVFSPEVHTIPQFGAMAAQHDTKVKEFETNSIRFYGVHPKTKQWVRLALYGGMQAENVTQAVARDLLAVTMVRAEERGYPIVLHIHDELVADAPHGKGSLAELREIMLDSPSWAAGLPLDAAGCESERFKK